MTISGEILTRFTTVESEVLRTRNMINLNSTNINFNRLNINNIKNNDLLIADLSNVVSNEQTLLLDLSGVVATDISNLAYLSNVVATDISNLADLSNVVATDISNLAYLSNVVATDISNLAYLSNVVATDISNLADLSNVVSEEQTMLVDISQNVHFFTIDTSNKTITWGHDGATASGDYSTAWGDGWADGDYSTAWGCSTATGYYSTAWGDDGCTASGDYSTAWGDGWAYGNYSTAWGEGTANGDYSTAWGDGTASGDYSTALGCSTANGDYSIAGGSSTASGDYSTAWGGGNAYGDYSIAGGSSTASGDYSTTWGWGWAEGTYSIAMGYGTARGDYSTAMGSGTANQMFSVAMGSETIADWECETVVGKFNKIPDNNSVFVVGCGTTAGRDNALVVGVQGDTTIKNLTVDLSTNLQNTSCSDLYVNGTLNLGSGNIYGPATITIDPAAIGNNTGAVHIKGNLYVDGSNTIINSQTLELSDNIIVLNGVKDFVSAGIQVKRHDAADTSSVFFVWNEISDTWDTSGQDLQCERLYVNGTPDFHSNKMNVNSDFTIKPFYHGGVVPGILTIDASLQVEYNLVVQEHTQLVDVSCTTLDVSDNLVVKGGLTIHGDLSNHRLVITDTSVNTLTSNLAITDISVNSIIQTVIDISNFDLSSTTITTSSSNITDTSYTITPLGSDLDGSGADDRFGTAIALSSDGTIVAIGAPNNDNANGANAGLVQVFQWNDISWIQLGTDLIGESAADIFGSSVSLSSNGYILAIGAPGDDPASGENAGHVRVYQWNDTSWTQLGADIDGEAADVRCGTSVSLSSDGLVVAIGEPRSSSNGSQSGQVRVYQYISSSWIQFGGDIYGEAASDYSASSLSLSSDGSYVAIGATYNDGGGTDSGHVRVFHYNDSSWVQYGQDLDGVAANDQAGVSVSLSSTGQIVAVGAHANDPPVGTNAGHVRIFQYTDSSWLQLGQDIEGEALWDLAGIRISLSASGDIVAIGAVNNDGTGGDSGHARIYMYNTTDNSWIQIGHDLNGEAAGDQAGSNIALSSDGKTVAVGAMFNDVGGGVSNAGHVRIYDISAIHTYTTSLSTTNTLLVSENLVVQEHTQLVDVSCTKLDVSQNLNVKGSLTVDNITFSDISNIVSNLDSSMSVAFTRLNDPCFNNLTVLSKTQLFDVSLTNLDVSDTLIINGGNFNFNYTSEVSANYINSFNNLYNLNISGDLFSTGLNIQISYSDKLDIYVLKRSTNILYSNDGITWNEGKENGTNLNWTNTVLDGTIEWFGENINKFFFTQGRNQPTNEANRTIYSSSDGINWTYITANGLAYQYCPKSMAFSPTLNKIVATGTGNNKEGLWVYDLSSSSHEFNQIQIDNEYISPWESDGGLLFIVWDIYLEKFILITGSTGGGKQIYYNSSSDLSENWTLITNIYDYQNNLNANGTINKGFNSIAYSPYLKRTVAVGPNSVIYYSDFSNNIQDISNLVFKETRIINGSTNLSNSSTYTDIIWDTLSQKFIVSASTGDYAMIYSEDGISWTSNLSASGDYISLTYGNGKLLLIEESGIYLTDENNIAIIEKESYKFGNSNLDICSNNIYSSGTINANDISCTNLDVSEKLTTHDLHVNGVLKILDGGSVEQQTSKSTDVTINNRSGRITLNNESIDHNTAKSFFVNNTTTLSGDVIMSTAYANNAYRLYFQAHSPIDNSGFHVELVNITGSTLTDSESYNFVLINSGVS